MSCECAYESDLDARPSVYRREDRTARVFHICCECGEEIAPREPYESATGCWDGSWDTYNTCKLCKRIRDDYCVCAHTQLREHLRDVLGFDYVTEEES